jgi:multidrug resistance efflux pump
VAIPVKPNVPVKANDVLFQIDPAPFQYKVTQLQASLAGAKQQTEILKSNYEQATSNDEGLAVQVAYNKKRLADIRTLAADEASTQFQAQNKQIQYETVCRRSLAPPRRRTHSPEHLSSVIQKEFCNTIEGIADATPIATCK